MTLTRRPSSCSALVRLYQPLDRVSDATVLQPPSGAAGA